MVVALERSGRVLVHRDRRVAPPRDLRAPRAPSTPLALTAPTAPFAPFAPSTEPPPWVASKLAEADAQLAEARRTSTAAAAALREARAMLARPRASGAPCPDCSAAEAAVESARHNLALAQTSLTVVELELAAVAALAAKICLTIWIPGTALICAAAVALVVAATAVVYLANRVVNDAQYALDQARKALEDCRNTEDPNCGEVSGVSGVSWRRPLRARPPGTIVLA